VHMWQQHLHIAVNMSTDVQVRWPGLHSSVVLDLDHLQVWQAVVSASNMGRGLAGRRER
jgi:hypothetical protein